MRISPSLLQFPTRLSITGFAILILLMFVGRLGPLVVAMAVSRQKAPRYYYAEERIMIG